MTSFADYLNDEKAENIDESEVGDNKENLDESSSSPRSYKTPEITLQSLETAMCVMDKLVGNIVSITPLDMKIKRDTVYFVWYDDNMMEYNINSFNPKKGVSQPLEDSVTSLSEAKKLLKSM